MPSSFLDTIYGDISFDDRIGQLLSAPVMQRLRHVRLSNIDSIAMPGMGTLSRFEHVIGVAYLARNVGFASKLSQNDLTALESAALLHDWAITAFGHLVEEAFAYVGAKFNHEDKLREIVMNEIEIGGVDRQIFCGRESGLRHWIRKIVGRQEEESFLSEITDCIRGTGKFGRLVCGDIDLDNIDNVFRMAFHMGLSLDREVPLKLASAIVGLRTEDGSPVFRRDAGLDIDKWVATRRMVYERLMLAEPDFSAKLMLLYAAVLAYQHNEITVEDWNMTDNEFVRRLSSSAVKECCETVDRWQVGEFWVTTPLVWMNGERPAFKDVLTFSDRLSKTLHRRCFAYCIKDKRDRQLTVHFDDGEVEIFGRKSEQWLLGVGSSKRQAFTSSESVSVTKLAEEFFKTSFRSKVTTDHTGKKQESDQLCLL